MTRYRTTIFTLAVVLAISATTYAGDLIGCDAFSTAIGTIDRDDGSWTHIGASGAVITGMTYDSNHGVMYGISPNNDTLFKIDPTSGIATPIGAYGTLGYENANGLAYDPVHDILYGTDNNTNHLFQVDTVTGTSTFIAEISGGFTEIEGLGYDPVHEVLYGLTALQRRIVSIDTNTGLATAVSNELPSAVWRGLEWDPVYGVLYASAVNIFEDASIYNYNPQNNRLSFRGHAIGVEAVQGLAVLPEPSTLLLLVSAIPLLRRR